MAVQSYKQVSTIKKCIMIEITRHEKDGILQGFQFYSPEPIVLVVFTDRVLQSVTSYRGHCEVGAPNASCQAVAFADMQQAQQFIDDNGLVSEGAHPFHDEEIDKDFQVFMSKDQSIAISEDMPELGVYRKQNNIRLYKEPDGVYFYVNYFEPGHREFLENYGKVTPNAETIN
jgi:hypothetical protein